MNISIDNLILEVTRKCNMECDHCLRGKAQNINMSKKIIDKALEQINRISMISFSGGEPSLNTEAINYFAKKVIKEKYDLDTFWLATNAKEYKPELVLTLLDLYDYCFERAGELEAGGLAISQDMFHDEVSSSNINRYKALSFYDDSKEVNFNKTRIINEGNARENGIGSTSIKEEKLYIECYNDEIMIEELYINAKGDVIPGCDFSYETQEKIKLGNIMEEPLLKILKRADPELPKNLRDQAA